MKFINTEIKENTMKLKDTTIKEFFKTLDYYNSPLFENSFSDKFIYNSNIFSVNEKISIRFLKQSSTVLGILKTFLKNF